MQTQPPPTWFGGQNLLPQGPVVFTVNSTANAIIELFVDTVSQGTQSLLGASWTVTLTAGTVTVDAVCSTPNGVGHDTITFVGY